MASHSHGDSCLTTVVLRDRNILADSATLLRRTHRDSGATANRSARFQAGGCGALAFKPKFATKVTGGTTRNDHPRLQRHGHLPRRLATPTAKTSRSPSRIRSSSTSPTSTPSAPAPRRQFRPAPKVPSTATPKPKPAPRRQADRDPVFLKSSDHQLPDLAIALKGPDSQPIEVEFALPDVPVSKFVLRMKGGNKGHLVNSRNLCSGKPGRMAVNMTAQNNKRSDTRPLLKNGCSKKSKKVSTSAIRSCAGDDRPLLELRFTTMPPIAFLLLRNARLVHVCLLPSAIKLHVERHHLGRGLWARQPAVALLALFAPPLAECRWADLELSPPRLATDRRNAAAC
jgi:hypothetical protein